jgi:hypothetical protein
MGIRSRQCSWENSDSLVGRLKMRGLAHHGDFKFSTITDPGPRQRSLGSIAAALADAGAAHIMAMKSSLEILNTAEPKKTTA